MEEVESPVCFVNDRYLSRDEIRIDPYDLGFLRGYAVFDVLPVENGKAFLWERHFARLARSAITLGLRMPVDEAAYGAILDELIRRNMGKAAAFRTVLSGGPSEDAFTPVVGGETFLVLSEPMHPTPTESYSRGVKAIMLEYERPLPQVKLANHVLAIRDQTRRIAAGAFETIYVNDGTVSEASRGSLFIVKDGRLVTTWDNVLWGITQGLVLELAEAAGILADKRALVLAELFSADEVFITGSTKGIVPVVRVDDTVIGNGVSGTVTRQLMAAYDAYRKRY